MHYVKLNNFLALFFLLLVGYGCVGDKPTPDWFQYQYEDGSLVTALTECGPTVSSNSLCWQTGICHGRKYARATRVSPPWWYMIHIVHFVNSEGGEAELKNFSVQAVSKDIHAGGLAVVHVNHTHFVTVRMVNGSVRVLDTNAGRYSPTSIETALESVSFGKYVSIPRLN